MIDYFSDADTLTKAQARARVFAIDRLTWVQTYVDISAASGDADSKTLNPNQIFCIGDYHPFQAAEKGRQEGHSFAFAADSIARAVMEPRSQSVHISTDKWEAQKKQIYCMRILDSLKGRGKQDTRIKSESKNRIEFMNGSLIDFLACRPPRGADRASIYLDEFAFMPGVQEMLKAALGCTTHGGYIRIGSTHCGALSEFFKIVKNLPDEFGRNPYQNWNRGYFPWWTCPTLSVDPTRAFLEAPGMDTAARVAKFGNEKLKQIFAGYPLLEEFQEEFECVVVDEAHSFFPLSLINRCIPPKLVDDYFDYVPDVDGKSNTSLDAAKLAVQNLARAWESGEVPGELLAGFDIGRRVDKDEITICSDHNESVCLRLLISMSNMPFEKKEEIWDFIMQELPITRGFVDGTPGSMGMPLAEKMHTRYGEKSGIFEFSMQSKAELANGMKIRMTRGGIIIPQPLPALIRQIHSIKKRVTAANNEVFDVEANREHHGDKFWSFAMCASLGHDINRPNSNFEVEVAQRQNSFADNNLIWTPGNDLGGEMNDEILEAYLSGSLGAIGGAVVGKRKGHNW
jgi:phage FluMu gp28-like protein